MQRWGTCWNQTWSRCPESCLWNSSSGVCEAAQRCMDDTMSYGVSQYIFSVMYALFAVACVGATLRYKFVKKRAINTHRHQVILFLGLGAAFRSVSFFVSVPDPSAGPPTLTVTIVAEVNACLKDICFIYVFCMLVMFLAEMKIFMFQERRMGRLRPFLFALMAVVSIDRLAWAAFEAVDDTADRNNQQSLNKKVEFLNYTFEAADDATADEDNLKWAGLLVNFCRAIMYTIFALLVYCALSFSRQLVNRSMAVAKVATPRRGVRASGLNWRSGCKSRRWRLGTS